MADKPAGGAATIEKPASGVETPKPGEKPAEPKPGASGAAPAAAGNGGKPAEGAPATPAEASARKWKLKNHDGKELEITDEQELVRRAQLGVGAEKAIQEHKELKKDLEQLMAILSDDKRAFEVFKRMGKDPLKIAEDLIYERIKLEQMDPKEREALEWKRRADENARKVAEYERKAAEQQLTSLTNHFKSDYEKRVIQAMEKSDLPKNRHTARMILEEIAGAVQRGEEVPEASALAEKVSARYRELSTGFFSNRDVKTIAEMLGPDLRKKLRELDLAEVGQPAGGGEQPPTPEPTKPEPHPLSRKSWEDRRMSVEERLKRIKEGQE